MSVRTILCEGPDSGWRRSFAKREGETGGAVRSCRTARRPYLTTIVAVILG